MRESQAAPLMSHLSGLNSTGQPELKEREREKEGDREGENTSKRSLEGGKAAQERKK